MRERTQQNPLTLVPVTMAVAVGVLFLALIPLQGEPAILIAKVLVALAGASLVLVSGDALVRGLRQRTRTPEVRPVAIVLAAAAAISAGLVAALVLPRADGVAPVLARWLAVAAVTGLAGHAGSVAATRAWRLQRASERWTARPVESALLRTALFLVPVGASLACAIALDRTLPPAPDGATLFGRIAVVMLGSYVTLFLVERLMRRLAPLAMLLKLSMAFPGPAPSRFAVARRSGNPRALQRQLEEARAHSDGDRAHAAGTILSLATALTAHDARTRGHSERVRVFTDMLAEELHLARDDRDRLRWTALLHDIGKLMVPIKILNKRGPLDRRQWDVMYRHPIEGAKIIAPLAQWLGPWAEAVEAHHERYDGGGYPNGVAGTDIPYGARIISVADAFDTMTSPRPYRAAMTPRAAREEIVRVAGQHFDPVVARAMLSLSIRRLWWRMGLVSWLGQLPLLGRVPQAVPPVSEVAAGIRTATAVAGIAAVTALPSLEGGMQTAEASSGPTVTQPASKPAVVDAKAHADDGDEDATRGRSRDSAADTREDAPAVSEADEPVADSDPPATNQGGSAGGQQSDQKDDPKPGPQGTGPPPQDETEDEDDEGEGDDDDEGDDEDDIPGNAFGHTNGQGHTDHGNGLGTGHDGHPHD